MLVVLFILNAVGAVVTLVLNVLFQSLAKKEQIGAKHRLLSVIQGACVGASVGILAILLIKGRTLM